MIARIYAFRDPLSSLVLKKAAVKYQDTEMLWLDDSKENGGKSWLNPYSEVAQMYIADLSLECIRAGCSAVMLDGVQFPTGYSLELAGYGTQTKTHQQVLSDFVQDMEELLKENHGVLIYASSTQAMLGMEADSYDTGGLYYPIENFCPDVRPASFANGIRPESLTIDDPAGQPYDTVKTVLTQLKNLGADKNFRQCCRLIRIRHLLWSIQRCKWKNRFVPWRNAVSRDIFYTVSREVILSHNR